MRAADTIALKEQTVQGVQFHVGGHAGEILGQTDHGDSEFALTTFQDLRNHLVARTHVKDVGQFAGDDDAARGQGELTRFCVDDPTQGSALREALEG